MITTVGELGSVLSNVTPTASAMGVEFEQIGAAIASMTAAGTPAAQSTTQLNSLFAELGKDGTKASIALAEATEGTEYAGKSFQELNTDGVKLNEILDLMGDYAEENGVGMLDMFSSIEAGKAALALSGENAAGFSENLSAMSTEADVVTEAFEKVSSTTDEQFNKALNELKNVAIEVFAAFLPVINKLLPVLSELVGAAIEVVMPFVDILVDLIDVAVLPLIEAIKPLTDAVLPLLTTLLDAIMPIVSGLATMISDVLITAIEFLGDSVEWITGVLEPFFNLLSGISKVAGVAAEAFGKGFSGETSYTESYDPYGTGGSTSSGSGSYGYPGYATGIDEVPMDMTVDVHKGEKILNVQASNALNAMQSGGGLLSGGGGGNVNNINVVMQNEISSDYDVNRIGTVLTNKLINEGAL